MKKIILQPIGDEEPLKGQKTLHLSQRAKTSSYCTTKKSPYLVQENM